MVTSFPFASAPPPALMKAIAHLRVDENQAALEVVEAVLPSAPDRAPLLGLAGLAALRLGLWGRAIPYLQELLALSPADRATQANLANALIGADRLDEAMEIVGGAVDPSLARIEGYIHQRRHAFDSAAAAYRRAIEGAPNDLSSWNNLGNVLDALGETDEAITAFERAISIAPADVPIYINLANLLMRADRQAPRLKALQDAEKIAPTDARLLTELGLAYAANDNYDAAIETLERAIGQSPDFTDAHIELGMIFESLNRVDDLAKLVANVDKEKAPDEFAFLLAWQARREGRFDDAAALAATIPESFHPMRRLHLIGGIAERRGDVAAAFPAFEQMNREAVAASPPFVGKSYRSLVEEDIARWTDAWAAPWQSVQTNDGFRDPVFLVGFPRSGTTLLDTMLMGLPTLSVLEERPMMARTIRLIGEEHLPTMSADRIAEFRTAYFDAAREYGWDDTKRLVDKHPLNMGRVPAVHRLFPNAHFILAERHPYDVVLSCFMANFQMNLAMRSFTTLEETARTYNSVFSAWQRGKSLFPIATYPVRYERLVEDSAAELSPLVEWLGEEWHDDLLDHQKSASRRGQVRTASYSQIGEQLYTRARDRWRRYADQLAPVMPILRPWVEKMGYAAD